MQWRHIVFGVCLLGLGICIGFLVQTTHTKAQTAPPSVSPTGTISPSGAVGGVSLPSENSVPSVSLPSQSQPLVGTGNAPLPPAPGIDPSIQSHTNPNGGRTDIVQIGQITVSQPEAYTGDDITFTVTLENVAPYKKFVRQVCFNSNEGDFGCTPGFNLNPGQVFSLSNSGRFTSSGVKFVGVSWTQDNVNFYSPLDASSATVTIL